MKLAVIYGSSRENGNSEQLTEVVLKNLTATRFYLRNHHIEPIIDKRHTAEGFSPVDDDYHEIITQVMEHDILLFVTPLYWYGMSGHMKNFVDRWSHSLRDQRYDFKGAMKGKKAFAIIVGGDSARVKGLPLVQQFQYIFDFMSMEFCGYLIGQGSKPGDVMKDGVGLSAAEHLHQQLKSLLQHG